MTAFTFDRAMNPRADWAKLSGGLYSRAHSFADFLFCNTDALARYTFMLVNVFEREYKFSVVYTYQNATGDEKIIEGTRAMVEP